MDWEDLNISTQNEWITKAEYLVKRGYVSNIRIDLVEFAKKLYLKRINSSEGNDYESFPPPKQ